MRNYCKIGSIFNNEIKRYLIVTERFIRDDIRTYAFLRFEKHTDVHKDKAFFTDNDIIYKGITHKVSDEKTAFQYLLKTVEERKEILTNTQKM